MDRHTLKERESSAEMEKDRVRHTYIDTCIIHTCIQTDNRQQTNYISMLPFYATSVKCTLGKFLSQCKYKLDIPQHSSNFSPGFPRHLI